MFVCVYLLEILTILSMTFNKENIMWRIFLSTRAVQQRPIILYSVISFSIRSVDSLTDYSGESK